MNNTSPYLVTSAGVAKLVKSNVSFKEYCEAAANDKAGELIERIVSERIVSRMKFIVFLYGRPFDFSGYDLAETKELVAELYLGEIYVEIATL